MTRHGRRLSDAALIAATLAALVAVAASRTVQHVNADSLLYTLMSTMKVTWFYWGQDRLLNVVPAIASPVRDETVNFAVQSLLLGLSFFLLLMLIAGFHLASRVGRVPVLSLCGITLVAGLAATFLMDSRTAYGFIFEQQYSLSFVLLFVGLAGFVTDRRVVRVGGAVLVLLAVLIIPAVVAFVPLAGVLGHGADRFWRRRTFEALALGVAAFAVGGVLARVAYDGPENATYSSFSLQRVVDGLPATWDNVTSTVEGPWVVLLLAVSIGVLVAAWPHLPSRLRRAYVVSGMLTVIWLIAFSANEWVELNLFSERYFFPCYVFALAVGIGAACEVAVWMLRRVSEAEHSWPVRSVRATSAVLLVALTAVGSSRTMAAEVPDLVAAQAPARAAIELDAQLVIGDYWLVWPAVFVGNDLGADLVGLTYRSEAIGERIAAVIDDYDAGRTTAVTAVCVDGVVESCIAQLSGATGRGWQVAATRSESPLVVDLVAS